MVLCISYDTEIIDIMSRSTKEFWRVPNALNSIKEVIVSFQGMKKCQGHYFKKNCSLKELYKTRLLFNHLENNKMVKLTTHQFYGISGILNHVTIEASLFHSYLFFFVVVVVVNLKMDP